MIHRRWFLVSIRVLIGLPLAAALAAIIALLVTGVTIDASRWRDASAERVSAALGRTVILEGPFELSLGREAELRIGGVRILNPSGFTAEESLALAEARVRIDLSTCSTPCAASGTCTASRPAMFACGSNEQAMGATTGRRRNRVLRIALGARSASGRLRCIGWPSTTAMRARRRATP
jgi:uncharacterized protein YfaP (DUF2135 family)